MTRLAQITSVVALGAVALALPPTPRKSPEFTFIDSSGKTTPLTSMRGKVVLIEFLWTNCPHCQRASQTITKLYREFGPRGFRAIGVAIDANITDRMVTNFVKQSGVTYPVAYSTPVAVDSYLGRAPMERLMLPQIVIVDREGVIRAQSGPSSDQNIVDNESMLRGLLESLLR